MPKTWSENIKLTNFLTLILSRSIIFVIISIILTGCGHQVTVKCDEEEPQNTPKNTTTKISNDPWWGPWDPR